MAHTWLHWGEWIIIWDFFFFELWLTEHNMYAEQARWVESLSESLAFVPLAVETTTWVSHQTGVFLHLSTLPLLVELDMMKISTLLLGNKKSLISRMGVLAFLIWPFQAMEELPSFWPSEDPPGWSGWGKDSPFHLSTSSSVKGVDSEAVREVLGVPDHPSITFSLMPRGTGVGFRNQQWTENVWWCVGSASQRRHGVCFQRCCQLAVLFEGSYFLPSKLRLPCVNE